MDFYTRSERRGIGIITGSGPEAGVDLWSKVVEEAKSLLGDGYLGDLDAPRVHIVSSPSLGLSMELEQFDIVIWPEIRRIFEGLSQKVDYISIACNTLNYYSRQLETCPFDARLISVTDVAREHLQRFGRKTVALLGAAPVTKMDRWSAYLPLQEEFEIETPADTALLHQVIYDVKRIGPKDPGVISRFGHIVGGLKAETVLLACTELPLIPLVSPNKDVVDVTRLLARKLVRKAYLTNEE